MFIVDTPTWRSEDDGSLRGHFPEERCEYILKKPIKIGNAKKALVELRDILDNGGARLDFSYRTSVHVHVNVQELNIDQVMNMAYVYLLLEEPFLNYCGKERKGCQFALRLADAEGLVDHIQNIFEFGEDGLHMIPRDAIRYSAINFEALSKYGSLEFRGMRGNLDVEVINNWCNMLTCIRAFATQYENPLAIFKQFRSIGAKEFLKMVVGAAADVLAYPRMEQDIQRNFSLTIDLPVAFRKLAEKRKIPKPKYDEEYYPGRVLTYQETVKFVQTFKNGHAYIKNIPGRNGADGMPMYELLPAVVELFANKRAVKIEAIRPWNVNQPVAIDEWFAEEPR